MKAAKIQLNEPLKIQGLKNSVKHDVAYGTIKTVLNQQELMQKPPVARRVLAEGMHKITLEFDERVDGLKERLASLGTILPGKVPKDSPAQSSTDVPSAMDVSGSTLSLKLREPLPHTAVADSHTREALGELCIFLRKVLTETRHVLHVRVKEGSPVEVISEKLSCLGVVSPMARDAHEASVCDTEAYKAEMMQNSPGLLSPREAAPIVLSCANACECFDGQSKSHCRQERHGHYQPRPIGFFQLAAQKDEDRRDRRGRGRGARVSWPSWPLVQSSCWKAGKTSMDFEQCVNVW